jgi:hypothetical protein
MVAFNPSHRCPSVMTALPTVDDPDVLVCNCILKWNVLFTFNLRRCLARITAYPQIARFVQIVAEETGATYTLPEIKNADGSVRHPATQRPRLRRAFFFAGSERAEQRSVRAGSAVAPPFVAIRFCSCGDLFRPGVFATRPGAGSGRGGEGNLVLWGAMYRLNRRATLHRLAQDLQHGTSTCGGSLGPLHMVYIQFKRAVALRAELEQIFRERGSAAGVLYKKCEAKLARIVDVKYAANNCTLRSLRECDAAFVDRLLDKVTVPFPFAEYPLHSSFLFPPGGLSMRKLLGCMQDHKNTVLTATNVANECEWDSVSADAGTTASRSRLAKKAKSGDEPPRRPCPRGCGRDYANESTLQTHLKQCTAQLAGAAQAGGVVALATVPPPIAPPPVAGGAAVEPRRPCPRGCGKDYANPSTLQTHLKKCTAQPAGAAAAGGVAVQPPIAPYANATGIAVGR